MEAQHPTLPTSRELITSLINTLTTPLQQQSTNNQSNRPLNPLQNLPPSHRKILTTLHVLFPPGVLLQALDLLDRGLVTRIIENPDSVYPPQAHIHLPTKKQNQVYLVKSAQGLKSRFSHSGSGGAGLVYVVRLGAWGCSCAAFTFSAFPAHAMQRCPWDVVGGDEGFGDGCEGGEWEFGGLSLDGRDGSGGVPVCKHLLACLLAERWDGVVGAFVKERVVGREEMGGLGAES